jgi:hypothetical protein
MTLATPHQRRALPNYGEFSGQSEDYLVLLPSTETCGDDIEISNSEYLIDIIGYLDICAKANAMLHYRHVTTLISICSQKQVLTTV